MKFSGRGEILLKGKTLGSYIEKNKLRSTLDEKGWFHTGDLGELTGEGNLIVKGRLDNMFISGGENIHPEEIEGYLLKHPNVLQAMVVPVKNAEFGSRPVAILRRRNKRITSAQEISAHLEKSLPKYKIPECFFDWPSQPDDHFKLTRRHFANLLERDPQKFSVLS